MVNCQGKVGISEVSKMMQTNITVNITSWPTDALVVEAAPVILALMLSIFASIVGHWKRSPMAYLVAAVLWWITGGHAILNPTIVPANVGWILMLVGLMYLGLAVGEFMLPGFRRVNYYDRSVRSYRRRSSRR